MGKEEGHRKQGFESSWFRWTNAIYSISDSRNTYLEQAQVISYICQYLLAISENNNKPKTKPKEAGRNQWQCLSSS